MLCPYLKRSLPDPPAEGADCVGTADGTIDACLLWLASLVDGVLVVVGWVGVPVVGLLRVIPAI